MPSLELNNDEVEILAEYLQRVLSDLSVEISATDRQTYREEIKAERRLLQHVVEQLAYLKHTGPSATPRAPHHSE